MSNEIAVFGGIVAKYEEIYPPTSDEFVYISDNTYKRHEIHEMELIVLKTLDYRLNAATAKVFLRRFLKAAATHSQPRDKVVQVNMLANYLCELALADYNCIGYRQSMIAAAAVAVALHVNGIERWDDTLVYVSQQRCMTSATVTFCR